MSVTPLDPLTLPITQRRLIEASAGTGKTYTISGLYLRLLLGDQQRSPLTCEQILVVTFTNAATEELRDRIRNRIRLCYQRFIGLDVDDDFINQLYQQTSEADLQLVLRRLDLALKSLDEAAIYTIHGFCQRILSDMAFESALLFESEFTLDDSEYLHHSVRDFWRRDCYNIEQYLAEKLIDGKLTDPDALMSQVRSLLGANQAIPLNTPPTFSAIRQGLNQQLLALHSYWQQQKDQHIRLLFDLPLNGQTYGKKDLGYPKLAEMLDAMDNWSKAWHDGNKKLPPAKAMEKLALNNIKLNKGGVLPQPEDAPLLVHIEHFHAIINDVIPAFLFEARSCINKEFQKLKYDSNILSPDDLLLTLANVIKQISFLDKPSEDDLLEAKSPKTASIPISDSLSNSIRQRFPVALIDEFQDTDPLQFSIFSTIYPDVTSQEDNNNALLMIGDPKQAIYAFRGADIYTYIHARKNTQHHYNLDTNYRSSQGMVTAVNQLFANRPNAFTNDAILFEQVKSADQGEKTMTQAAMTNQALQLRLLSEDAISGLNKTTGRQYLAQDAANQIAQILNDSQQNNCQFNQLKKGISTAVKAKNIAILVRDRNEAAVMRDALNERGIGAVFLSRDSVMHTAEAREMVLILRAIANPKNEQAIRAALACRLIGYTASQIDDFNQSENCRAQVLEQFILLNKIWQTRGIIPALLTLASQQKLLERLKQQPQAERRLTDFRHISELLQQKSAELDGMSALINWFEMEISQSNGNELQQMRLESEQNLVQIVTIHKSKGLEYPICFIPFISLSRNTSNVKPSPLMYHQNDQLIWDIYSTDNGHDIYKQEQLAEDLRLLYVALTRPIYRCYLSIANHSKMNKSGINSYLYSTAIGYLLGIDTKGCDFTDLYQAVTTLCSNAITMNIIDCDADKIMLNNQNSMSSELLTAQIPGNKQSTPWRVGSYSGLVRHLPHEKITPGAEDENFDDELSIIEDEPSTAPSRFNFDRGSNAGSFMHLVMELIDFENATQDLPLHLPAAMSQYGFSDEYWYETLYHWYLDILTTDLKQNDNSHSLTLAKISPNNKLVEMEFYLPLVSIQSKSLSRLLNEYGYNGNLEFDSFKGMLKGFIDVIFEANGQFYIADYKSNHLGNDFQDYNQIKMTAAISQHRYDLQYLIYTLAVHRYLSQRLPNYQYHSHFGGCYYLFLRGMSCTSPNTGVYFDKPQESLIMALDKLLSQSINEANASLETGL